GPGTAGSAAPAAPPGRPAGPRAGPPGPPRSGTPAAAAAPPDPDRPDPARPPPPAMDGAGRPGRTRHARLHEIAFRGLTADETPMRTGEPVRGGRRDRCPRCERRPDESGPAARSSATVGGLCTPSGCFLLAAAGACRPTDRHP